MRKNPLIMNRMGQSHRGFRFLALVMSSAAVAGSAWAQWPTQYNNPTIIASGNNVLAGDVRVYPDGIIKFAADNVMPSGKHGLRSLAMEQSGEQLVYSEDMGPAGDLVARKVRVLGPQVSAANIEVLAHFSPSLLSEAGINCGTYRASVNGSNINSETISAKFRYLAGIEKGSQLRMIAFNELSHQMVAFGNNDLISNVRDLSPEQIKDAQVHFGAGDRFYFAYTRYHHGDSTPSEIYMGNMGDLATIDLNGSVKIPGQAGPQEKPDWTNLGGSDDSMMLTWLHETGGLKSLYSRVYTSSTLIAPTLPLLANVSSYAVTPSTFNIPIVAAVQRDRNVYPYHDTLVAGLLGPMNGTAVTLPFATGFQMDGKTIRQESNGDFSIVYSVMESGTNLLKVLRVSGQTAQPLWTSTAADLGVRTQGDFDLFPNYAIDADEAGNLYILARRDFPYTDYSQWQAVRVRADGKLGPDDLKAPANPAVPQIYGNYVEINWSDQSNSETAYFVGRSAPDLSGLVVFDPLPVDREYFVDKTAAPHTSYLYFIGAYNAYTGQWEFTGPIPVTTTDEAAPA